MAFEFFKKTKQVTRTEEESVSQAPVDELSEEDRAFLEQFEQRARQNEPSDNDVEQRRREIEHVQKNYRPRTPLYHTGSNHIRSGDSHAVKGRPEEAPDKSQQKSYQNDPRYREYFERLRREGVQLRPSTNYDEEVKPVSLDQLDSSAWEKRPSPASTGRGLSTPTPLPPTRQQAPSRPASSSAAPSSSSSSTSWRPNGAASPPSAASSSGDDLQPGSLLRLDDGSIAIYKDAVSGKDYALFYFLEPTGRLEPRGIFLEQYEKQKIGQLSPSVLAQMIERKQWDRDAVIFHLDHYDYSSCIPRPDGSGNATPSGNSNGFRERPQTGHDATPTPYERRPATQSDVSTTRSSTGRATPPSGVPRRDALMERGRVLRINVGGRVWESVYWTEDEIGPIVAHNTNKDWALMHLDLKRFKDSLEYGDVVSYEQLSEIEASLASQGH